jgi:hypothetical protein
MEIGDTIQLTSTCNRTKTNRSGLEKGCNVGMGSAVEEMTTNKWRARLKVQNNSGGGGGGGGVALLKLGEKH